MIPFKVRTSNGSVGITWESLAWFFVVTAAATVVGELIYQKWVSPYLANLPSLPPINNGANNTAPVSVQTPSAMGRFR
jgi:hypothetical protein